MTTVLDIRADQQGEVFFISGGKHYNFADSYIFDMSLLKWLGPDEKDFSFIDSMYVDEEERDALIPSHFMAISGDGETIVTIDKFRGSEVEADFLKIQTIKTEDYICSLEDQNVEISFELSPLDEKGT